MNDKIGGIIRFQRMYRFYKEEMNTINKKLILTRNIVTSMYDNLEYLNNMNIYDNYKNGYNSILNDILDLSKDLNELPEYINFEYLRKSNKTINTVSKKIYEINNKVILYSNQICSNDLTQVIDLLLGFNYIYNLNKYEFDLYNLLQHVIVPISVWSSEQHKEQIINKEYKKRQILRNNSLDKLINMDEKISTLVLSDTELPQFITKLSETIISDKTKKDQRETIFKKDKIVKLFQDIDTNIIISDNYQNKSFIENFKGIIIHLKNNEEYICIQGLIKNDILDIYKSSNIISENLINIKKYLNYDVYTVPKNFKNNFIENLSLKDILLNSKESILISLKNKYNEYKKIKNKNLKVLINDFLLTSKHRKIDILTILLYSEEDSMIGYLLFDVMRIKDKKNITNDLLNSLPIKLRNLLDQGKEQLLDKEKELLEINLSDLSYERRISLLNVSNNIKEKAVSKLKNLKNNMQGDNKAQDWLDGLLKIPFGVYKNNSIMDFKKNFINELRKKYFFYEDRLQSSNDIEKFINEKCLRSYLKKWNEYKENKKKYLINVRKALDSSVYGHEESKKQIERIFAQWINGDSKGEILGLWGPPGTGKTSLAKNGLSQCLIDDDGIKRPFAFLPIGGSVNGSTLVGHNYTYVGSTWGRIVDILMTSQCMNPIIFIDELDKISNTENGREISSILTHLTDLTQNDSFEDKYFSGIPFDLSKALIVFSFNDIDRIDPILKDRITIIETKAFTLNDKINIIKDYMLPSILKEIGYNSDEIIFSDDIIKFLINTYTNEAGVRKIKEKILEIIREINLNKCFDNDIKIPYEIKKEFIEELFKDKPKMRIKKICSTPQVGMVNGLYATTTGIGGLTVIQILKYPSDKMLDLTITGQQGDVMKESVKYSLRLAFSLLPQEKQDEIINDSKDNKNFGLHVHTPDAATKKDGPSAGGAMTLAFYSILSGKKVNNKVALTGEIDLMNNITAIGGVGAKLNGAKQAGVELALIPKENLNDLSILRDKGISPEDDNFKVETIETIDDVLKHCLI